VIKGGGMISDKRQSWRTVRLDWQKPRKSGKDSMIFPIQSRYTSAKMKEG
jgi:hypothetical protein